MKLIFICENIRIFPNNIYFFFFIMIIVYAFNCLSNSYSLIIADLAENCAHLMNLPIIVQQKFYLKSAKTSKLG